MTQEAFDAALKFNAIFATRELELAFRTNIVGETICQPKNTFLLEGSWPS
jgi:hypothetical protein